MELHLKLIQVFPGSANEIQHAKYYRCSSFYLYQWGWWYGRKVRDRRAPLWSCKDFIIELLSNPLVVTIRLTDKQLWSNSNYDRILVIENVYPNRSYGISFYHKEGGRFVYTRWWRVRFCRYNLCRPIMQ